MNKKEDSQHHKMEEDGTPPPPAPVSGHTTAMGENDETKQEEEKKLEAAAAADVDLEQPPPSPIPCRVGKTEENSEEQGDEDDEEASLPLPTLVRTQARQLSRVGAIPIAGISASFTSSSPPQQEESVATAAEEQSDVENPPMTALECTTSSSTSSSTNSSTNASSDVTSPTPNVTATLVSDAEYEAELQRAILRTAVRASKVETEEDEKTARKCTPAVIASVFLGIVVLIIIIGTSVFAASPGTFGIDGRDANAGDDYEELLGNFIKSRSFDGGEALKEYASPQRTALRYIALEFPRVALDEKLIDRYAVATFFFSTGGTFWTNNTKWKSGDPVCIWHGIGCDEDGHVISISLADNNLRGSLPPELGMLTPRQVQGNKFTSGLTKLDLSSNGIKGSIPEQVSLLKSMEEFKVDNNALWGKIPIGISNWTALEVASFINNGVEGKIPGNLCEQEGRPQISVDCATVFCSCCTPNCLADDNAESVNATLPAPPTEEPPQDAGATTPADNEGPQDAGATTPADNEGDGSV